MRITAASVISQRGERTIDTVETGSKPRRGERHHPTALAVGIMLCNVV